MFLNSPEFFFKLSEASKNESDSSTIEILELSFELLFTPSVLLTFILISSIML